MTDYSIGGSSGTTGLSPWTAPTPAGKMAAVDPADTTTVPHGSGGADKWLTIGLLLGVAAYLFPNGSDDTAAINNVIGNGDDCHLLQAPASGTPYQVSAPLTPATGASLKGAQPWSASSNDSYSGAGGGQSGGTTIYLLPGFTGAAAIDLHNATGTQYYGVSLENICIECFNGSTGMHGIRLHGAWGAGFMSGVCVHDCNGDCLHTETDSTTNYNPDEWLFRWCKFSGSWGGYGVYSDNLPDSTFDNCNASGNQLDNWLVQYSLNTKLLACKGENSVAGSGYRFGGQGGLGRALGLYGCSSHLNYKDGVTFDNSAAGSGGRYRLDGFQSVNDGQAGGTTYAGYRAAGSPALVTGADCYAYGAAYGAYQGSSSAGMVFTGGDITGTTANFHDDGSNATPLANNVPANQQLNVTLGTTFSSATGTSAQNVTGMAVALGTGTWKLRGRILYTAHGTTGSTQTFAWTFGGTTSAAQVMWQFKAAAYTAPVYGTSLTTSSGLSPTLTTTTYAVEWEAHAVVTAAGTLQLTAQSTTSGDEVSVLAGSYLDITPAVA